MKKTENKSGKSGMQVMKKLMAFIGNYKIFLGLSIVLAAVTVILQLYIPILFGDAIDEVVAAHQVNFPEMWFYLKRIVFFTLVSALSAWIMNLINNRMTYRIVRDLRSQAIRHIQVLPLSYLDQHSSGDIVSRVIADTDILSDGLLLGFTQLFSGIVTIIVTLFFMFSKNVWITLLVICLTPLSFFVAKFISGRSFKMFQKQSETRGKQTALIDEMIGNQKVVKAFGYEEKASERFAEINKDLQKYSQQAVFYSSLTNPSTRFVNNVIYAGVALVGAFMILGGALTVGGLSVLLSYANQYMKPFNDISSVVTELQNALACAGRIFDLLEEEPEVAEASETLKDVKGEVDIKNVCFHYDESKKLIEDFNLHVKPGMRVAIVGPTGCGKSTFIKTIAVNVILAQSIHTCLAAEFETCFFRICSSMSLKDDVLHGESYYMVEIKSIKRILDLIAHKEYRVLCFVDEVLRGTNTVERIAASSQILKSLNSENSMCFVATHDIELTSLLEDRYENYHFREEVTDGDVTFSYQLLPGKATTRNAIRLLSIMGYQEDIIQKAEQMALEFVRNSHWQMLD